MTPISRPPHRPVGLGLLLGAAFAFGVPAAASAQTADSPTTVAPVAPPMPGTTGRQVWRIGDFSAVELVAREAGAAANDHPWRVEASLLREALSQIKVLRAGADRPLFAESEINQVVPVLVQAFGNARPDQDVSLVSSARHDDNTFLALSAVTARLFHVGGHLNMIVHDARQDFYDTLRGSGMAPSFTIGSRTQPGSMPIHGVGAKNLRADWLDFSNEAPTAEPAATGAAAPAATAAPVVPYNAPTSGWGVPLAGTAAPAVAPRAAAPAPAGNDAEQRLQTLKHLFDKGLITEPEYQKKRQEILQAL